MRARTIEVRGQSAAPVAAVWALLADVTTWSEWGAFDEAELERPGRDEPEGVGAVRRFRAGKVRNREEVVRFDPPRGFSYEVRAGDIPVRDYHADVDLTEEPEGGTTIIWRSRFQSRWPGLGGLIERRLRAFIEETVEGLARAAEAGSESGGAGRPGDHGDGAEVR